ncbi:MAG: prepilin-type N-terminal cleavage/methylation domain-containing protein [Candidatus Gastranaerophilales bacterium]|nr:prepilin-type N-terminal cleavage/methylation domain-containing protein [Candidatus Gastranaerophilales bacterium]
MKKKFFGFTLCEVLITLGIIGIIAEITIPNLIANIQEQSWKTAARVAYSKASQAVEQMKMEEGGSLAYYYVTPSSFKPEFMKYFKVIQDCGLLNVLLTVLGISGIRLFQVVNMLQDKL